MSSAPQKMGESHHFIQENGGLYKIDQKQQVLPEKGQFMPVFDLRSENALLGSFSSDSSLGQAFFWTFDSE